MEYADINFIYGFLYDIKGVPVLVFQIEGHPIDEFEAQFEVNSCHQHSLATADAKCRIKNAVRVLYAVGAYLLSSRWVICCMKQASLRLHFRVQCMRSCCIFFMHSL
jgi:hypothetical protein